MVINSKLSQMKISLCPVQIQLDPNSLIHFRQHEDIENISKRSITTCKIQIPETLIIRLTIHQFQIDDLIMYRVLEVLKCTTIRIVLILHRECRRNFETISIERDCSPFPFDLLNKFSKIIAEQVSFSISVRNQAQSKTDSSTVNFFHFLVQEKRKSNRSLTRDSFSLFDFSCRHKIFLF